MIAAQRNAMLMITRQGSRAGNRSRQTKMLRRWSRVVSVLLDCDSFNSAERRTNVTESKGERHEGVKRGSRTGEGRLHVGAGEGGTHS